MSKKKEREVGASPIRKMHNKEGEKGKNSKNVFSVFWNKTCAFLI